MLYKTGASCSPEEYKQTQPRDKGQYAPGYWIINTSFRCLTFQLIEHGQILKCNLPD